MSSGTDLVAKLRNDEIASVRAEAAAGRAEHILRSLDQRGMAQDLIRQQYTGRYPFELLQNANDAAAGTARGAGTVRFVLTETALVVADQGAGFGADEVRAICGLGRSSKDPRKSIGYKGLGFKSVGEISDRPQIVSGDTSFQFDEDRVRLAIEDALRAASPPAGATERPAMLRLPVFAFPFELADNDLGDDGPLIGRLVEEGFRSVLRFPIRPGVGRAEVERHLTGSLAPRLLLFLDATERLELKGTDGDFDATVAPEAGDDGEEILLETDGQIEHWLVFSRCHEVTDRSLLDGLGDAWREVEQVSVAVAVRLDDEGRPALGISEPLHVYFPTVEQTGFPVLLHGDFALELDRRHVARAPETRRYNEWLADRMAELVATVAESLATRFPSDGRVVAAVAPVAPPSDFAAHVTARVLRALLGSRFIPAVDGGPRLPGEALLLPGSVPDRASAHRFLARSDLGRLIVAEVEEHAPSRQLLAGDLEVEELVVSEVTRRLGAHWPSEDLAFYRWIVGWSGRLPGGLGRQLRDVRWVRVLGGDLRSPDEKLFFPRQRTEVQLPAGLAVPIVDGPDIAGLAGVLTEAGVRPFEWRQLLPEFVLPLLTDPATDEKQRAAAMEALRLYVATERGDQRLQAQSGRVLLRARPARGGPVTLRPANGLYFSERWLGQDRLEQIYGPFGSDDFLAEDPLASMEDRPGRSFYEWLGVSARPRVETAVADSPRAYSLGQLHRHPHAVQHPQAWKAWLADPSTADATRCAAGHEGRQQLRVSHALDRFEEVVDTQDPARLAALWQALAVDWVEYAPALTAEFFCDHAWHTSDDRNRPTPSLLAHALRSLPWVPAAQRGEAVLVEPGRVWQVVDDTPKRIRERVAVLPAELAAATGAAYLATALHLVDAARPSADDLALLLEDLAAEGPIDDERRETVLAATWAMRHLNDLLARGGAAPTRRPPFLTRFQGRHVFDQHPMAAADPLLRDTWEPIVPILDADKDVAALQRVFEIRQLDEAVGCVPLAQGIDTATTDAVRAKIDRVKPYLVAIAAKETRSREEGVIRGLRNLEVAACAELRLRYELDGMVRERDEAVSFIQTPPTDGRRRRLFGTAILEIDRETGEPHWYAFGPQLAQFLDVPTQGDAFALLLAGDAAIRRRFLESRHIPPEALEEARRRLDAPPDPEEDVMPSPYPTPRPGGGSGGEPGGGSPEGGGAAGGTTRRDPVEEDDVVPGDEQEEEEAYPEIDFDAVEATEGTVTATASPHRGKGGGDPLGRPGPEDFPAVERLRRRLGRRGEETVVNFERRRVAAMGWDPSAVVWRSQSRPYAPYDVESFDRDGKRYIEVKATTSDDPNSPFEISEAELQWALRHGPRYFIYRVTEVDTALPRIIWFQDPLALVRAGQAVLRVSGARLAFQHLDTSTPEPSER